MKVDTCLCVASSVSGRVKVKASAVREIKSPFDVENPDKLTEGTTPKALDKNQVVSTTHILNDY